MPTDSEEGQRSVAGPLHSLRQHIPFQIHSGTPSKKHHFQPHETVIPPHQQINCHFDLGKFPYESVKEFITIYSQGMTNLQGIGHPPTLPHQNHVRKQTAYVGQRHTNHPRRGVETIPPCHFTDTFLELRCSSTKQCFICNIGMGPLLGRKPSGIWSRFCHHCRSMQPCRHQAHISFHAVETGNGRCQNRKI